MCVHDHITLKTECPVVSLMFKSFFSVSLVWWGDFHHIKKKVKRASIVQYVTHLKVLYLLCSSLWTDILVLHEPSA